MSRITKEMVQAIVDYEMKSVKGMKKAYLFQLVRELIEERTYELSDESIVDFHNDIDGGFV